MPPLRLPATHATAPVLVGYSGGLDSTVLLHLLATGLLRGNGLRAVHVHHGLHGDADRWAEHCVRVCAGLGVALAVVRVAVDTHGGQGQEAAARGARHAAFAAALGEGEALALAHHRDDQAETFLLRALRASGPDGLAAMRPWRAFGSGWLWRPLLDTPRTALLAYAQAHALDWIEDTSNADTAFDRNFLRHRVMPVLRERWPQVDAALARGARLSAEATDLLDREDARTLANAATADPHVLRCDALRALPPQRRARALRRWIARLGLPPLPAHGVSRIETDLLDARDDAQPEFAWAGTRVMRWRDLLHADRRRGALPADWVVEWEGRDALALPTGDLLQFQTGIGGCDGNHDAAEVNAATSVASTYAFRFVAHARRGGERIVLPGRTHSHTLKHVLQDLGVPPWERELLPLLSDAEGRLLAAGDLIYSASFDAWLRQSGMRLKWVRS